MLLHLWDTLVMPIKGSISLKTWILHSMRTRQHFWVDCNRADIELSVLGATLRRTRGHIRYNLNTKLVLNVSQRWPGKKETSFLVQVHVSWHFWLKSKCSRDPCKWFRKTTTTETVSSPPTPLLLAWAFTWARTSRVRIDSWQLNFKSHKLASVENFQFYKTFKSQSSVSIVMGDYR